MNTASRKVLVVAATAFFGAAPLLAPVHVAHADGPVGRAARGYREAAHHRVETRDKERINNAGTAKVKKAGGRLLPRVAKLVLGTSSPGVPVLPGKTYTWPYSVTNASPTRADSVVFSAPLPANLQFVSAEQNCSWKAGSAVCQLGSLAPGASKVGVINAKVAESAKPQEAVTSQALVTWNRASTMAQFPVVRVADTSDVAVTKTAPALIRPGASVPYKITVTNNGPAPAQDVKLRDLVDAKGPVQTDKADSQCVSGGHGLSLACDLGSMAVGEKRTIKVLVKGGRGIRPGMIIRAPSDVSSSTIDTNLGNNHANAETKVTDLTAPRVISRNLRELPNTGAPIREMFHLAMLLFGSGLVLHRIGRPRRLR